MTRIINEVRKWREHRGFTQVKLAELLGVNVRTIQNIEHRQQTPNLATALRLSEYLCKPVDVLFRFEDSYRLPQVEPNPDNILRLGEYLFDTYGDLGNPHTLEGLSMYPDCTAKYNLLKLQGFI